MRGVRTVATAALVPAGAGARLDAAKRGASPALTDPQIWNIVNYIRAIGPHP